MRLHGVYSYLASGEKALCGYKIALTKTKVEQAGFKNGEDVEIRYLKDRIIIKKIDKK